MKNLIMKEFLFDYHHAKFQYSWRESLFHTSWFTKSWWDYLLEKPINLRTFICRVRGHAGVAWYNIYGYEPDMTCKFCDDDVG
jgi:hypothetical protein